METLTSDKIYERIREMVSLAQGSVKIASAWLKGKLIDELLNSINENVELEVILRASELQDLIITDERVFRKIREKGGKVFLCSRLHAKFVIVDGEKAVVGSANFTEPGLSDISSGNIEAGVFYEREDDPSQIEELIEYFENIKKNYANQLGEELLGFAINPVKTFSFEFFLVEEGVSEQSYVEVELGEGEKLLARITSIYSYDTGFFANPFTGTESGVFAPIEDFKKIFAGNNRDSDWVKSALYAYLNKNGRGVRIATAKVVGVVRGGRLETPKEAFPVGKPVGKASRESLEELLKKNQSGKGMEIPVNVGTLRDSDTKVYLDGKEILSKHLLVLGTTGSGKSFFAGELIKRLAQEMESLKIFILDPHGEYYESLIEKGVREEDIYRIEIEDTIFPLRGSETIEFIKNLGFPAIVSGNSATARQNSGLLNRYIKPSLEITSLREKSLMEIFGELRFEDEELREEFMDTLEGVYGRGVFENQNRVTEILLNSFDKDERFIIYDFRDITDSASRVNLAGMVMQKLFNINKEDKKERILLLEEAHNFAPEISYGDVSSGKDNLALTMARKIASEGRKFKLGMITITQRPAQVSKYVLSQMNTQVMFRTMNKVDLDTIASYVEFSQEENLMLLPSLQTGMCIISGVAVPFPIIAEIK